MQHCRLFSHKSRGPLLTIFTENQIRLHICTHTVKIIYEERLLRQLSGFEFRHLSKIQNRRPKQRCGQHTLARQKNIKNTQKNKKSARSFNHKNCKQILGIVQFWNLQFAIYGSILWMDPDPFQSH